MPAAGFGAAQGAIGAATDRGGRGGGRGDNDRGGRDRDFGTDIGRDRSRQQSGEPVRQRKKTQSAPKTTLGVPSVVDSIVKSGKVDKPKTAKDKLTQKLRRGRRANILADVDGATLGSANVLRSAARGAKLLFG